MGNILCWNHTKKSNLIVCADFHTASSCCGYFVTSVVKYSFFSDVRLFRRTVLRGLILMIQWDKLTTAFKHETHLSNMRKSSASSSSDFPLLSSFMHLTIMTRNSSKSTVPLPAHMQGTSSHHFTPHWRQFYII